MNYIELKITEYSSRIYIYIYEIKIVNSILFCNIKLSNFLDKMISSKTVRSMTMHTMYYSSTELSFERNSNAVDKNSIIMRFFSIFALISVIHRSYISVAVE